MANVFGFADVVDQCLVYHNDSIEDAFCGINGDETIQFTRHSKKLHCHNPKNWSIDKALRLKIVDNNMEGFSKMEIKHAGVAKKVYHKLGAPGMEIFKWMIKGNMIKNFPVTIDDVEMAEKVWGKDVLYIKGRTV